MKKQKYHTVGTVPKSNRTIGIIDALIPQTHFPDLVQALK
jgi:hypothetical protein